MIEKKEFTVSDTLFAKGLAISMILIHHLFYETLEYGMVTNQAAWISKVGVALFIFLSGFGLYRSYMNRGDTGIVRYYYIRFKRLYIPYWFAWVMFVPAGIVFFDRSLASVYGSDMLVKLIQNVLGIQMFFGFQGYNPTWWFVSLILGLYALSPAVFYLVERFGLVFVVLVALTFAVPNNFPLGVLIAYEFPFVLGVYVSRKRIIEKYADMMSNRIYLKFIIHISILLVLIWQRQAGILRPVSLLTQSITDGIISLLIVMVFYECLGKIRLLSQFFIFIGKHAYNIFLVHTFFFLLYFRSFIYSFDYVPVVFGVLLGLSLIASITMNVLMEKTGLKE